MANRFHVALSYPGEHRDYVEKVAHALSNTLTHDKVFYDRNYEAELSRPNLDTYLLQIYHEQSDLVVVFLSREYDKKDWCRLEFRAIRDLIKRRRDDEIMFVRVAEGDVAGVLGIDGFVDARNRPASEVASLICKRLRKPLIGSSPSAATRLPQRRTIVLWSATTAVVALILLGVALFVQSIDDVPPPELVPDLVRDLDIHFQRLRQTGSFDVLNPDSEPLELGDRLQFHVVLNRPAWVYLYWIDEKGEFTRVWPEDEDLAAQQPVDELYVPSLAPSHNPDRQQWIDVAGAPGLDLILAAATTRPLPVERLEEFEAHRMHPVFRDGSGTLTDFPVGRIRPGRGDITLPQLTLVLPEAVRLQVQRLDVPDVELDEADSFRRMLPDYFNAWQGIVFPHVLPTR